MPSYSDTKISFYHEGKITLNLAHRGALKRFITNIFKKEGVTLEALSYVFCSDKFLLNLNKTYLGHNEYTDIITFDLSDNGGVNGEVYISVDRIRENSTLHGTTIRSELHRVIFHGALHLCGYSDKTSKDKQEMRQKEDFYLQRYSRST